MEKYGVPEFSELPTSTRTAMAYSNMLFDINKIFTELEVEEIDVPLTKKKKNVDKKKLKAPYGSIISVQKGNRYRGIDLRRSKKHWCTANCRATKRKENETVKINTVIEEPHLIEGTDIKEIKYYCTMCERYYPLKQMKKTTHFRNQVTVVLSVENVLLHIMIFKSSFKIAGCKKEDHAFESTMILWQDYIQPNVELWSITDTFKGEEPRFVFRFVMSNVGFGLNFFINRQKLNALMNSEQYSDKIFMSQYENTSQTNVNIKMFSKQPDDYSYDCITFPLNTGGGNGPEKEPYFETLKDNPYKTSNASTKKKYITFIVFSSSNIILSGRYQKNMEKMYHFFVKEVIKNRGKIEEKIELKKVDLVTHLKKVKNV